jgi:hypothetical protein
MALTTEELNLIPNFIKLIRTTKSLTLNQIEAHYRHHGRKVSLVKVKEMIAHVRAKEQIRIGNDDCFLMSDDNGVWLTSDLSEINVFVKKLEKMQNAIATIKESAEKFLRVIEANRFINQSQKELFNGG